MRLLPKLLTSLIFFINYAYAFDVCETLGNDPEQLLRRITEKSIDRAPVKYHALARDIKIITNAPSETIIPFAVEIEDSKIIVLPIPFAKILCNLSYATFFDVEGIKSAAFNQAATSAGKCFESGGSQKSCLTQFSNNLSDQYKDLYIEQTDKVKETMRRIFYDALYQIVYHEYAHHFLDHFKRIKTKNITRPDAEFEADYFSILNATQGGQVPSAMIYFFNGLSKIEGYTDALVTPEYESAGCRAKNVANITIFTGAAPMALIATASGSGSQLERNSLTNVEAAAMPQFGNDPPRIGSSCGKLAEEVLKKAYEELKQLYLRMSRDSSLLLAKDEEMHVDQAVSLLYDLSDMTSRFTFMNELAAKTTSSIALRLTLHYKKRPISEVIERIINTNNVKDNIISEDYGILLNIQGLYILQERTELPDRIRYDRSYDILQRAVLYNPHISNAWMSLSFIAFSKGDCTAALRFSRQSVATLTQPEHRELITNFIAKMEKYSLDQKSCVAEAAKFHL